ncbi:MAG: TldD/PmbA family protein [Candidatus Lokiarchaeota archaeon]|nr:TldD/PmbA family protein [Candidatus Lokiarchaeota archaeon]
MEISDDLKLFDSTFINKLHREAENKIEYWDIRATYTEGTNLDFTDQKSTEISSYDITNCGIRTFINGGWGFYVLKNINKENIISSFLKSIKLANLTESLSKNKFKIKERDPFSENFKIDSKLKLSDVDIEDKIQLVKNHEKIASDYSKMVKNTRTIYMDGMNNYLFINSFGSQVKQNLSYLRLLNIVYSQKAGVIQRSINSVGGLGGFEISSTEKAQNLSQKTAEESIKLLDAKSPIGGKFSIIADSKLAGTLIHEALGHACEADLVLSKESVLKGKIGQKVALNDINVVDNPSMGQGRPFGLPYELFGCYFIDDEGIPSQKTIIIENGVLKNYLHNLETSSRMNVPPNGHGRASSSSSKPQVRMGFTYIEPKDWEIDELIADTKNGILCEDFLYGYTNPTTGNFQFKCKFSYKIENGEKKELMRDVALSGMILEVLNRVSAIGNKNTFNYSDGICGKGGQSVRVCDGGPYLRVEDITVGGLN